MRNATIGTQGQPSSRNISAHGPARAHLESGCRDELMLENRASKAPGGESEARWGCARGRPQLRMGVIMWRGHHGNLVLEEPSSDGECNVESSRVKSSGGKWRQVEAREGRGWQEKAGEGQ